jgi:hypothetical protein
VLAISAIVVTGCAAKDDPTLAKDVTDALIMNGSAGAIGKVSATEDGNVIITLSSGKDEFGSAWKGGLRQMATVVVSEVPRVKKVTYHDRNGEFLIAFPPD